MIEYPLCSAQNTKKIKKIKDLGDLFLLNNREILIIKSMYNQNKFDNMIGTIKCNMPGEKPSIYAGPDHTYIKGCNGEIYFPYWEDIVQLI